MKLNDPHDSKRVRYSKFGRSSWVISAGLCYVPMIGPKLAAIAD
jgi:hypothetical protein